MKKKFSLRRLARPVSGALAAVLTAGLLLASPTALPTVSAETATEQKYKDQMAELEATQQELLAKINSTSSEAQATAEYKQNLDYLISTVSTKIETANALLSELESKIADTEKSISEHETAITDTFAKFQERMRMSQDDGNASYLSILLGAGSIGDFLTRLDRVNSMLEYDKNMLEQYKTEKADLETEKADLESSKALQESTLVTLEADKAQNEALSSQASSYYEKLQSDTAAYTEQYAAARAAEQALDAQLTAYLQSLTAQNSSQVTADGAYMWPLPTGQGYISCHYGDSDPIGNAHYAVDCAISAGTPVYASNDGTVVTAEWHSSYGNYVVIDHGSGYATLYAHCSSLAVSAGQTVSKGQTIGYVGATGFATGNHLHFEFRVNGSKVNPLGYMSAGV